MDIYTIYKKHLFTSSIKPIELPEIQLYTKA